MNEFRLCNVIIFYLKNSYRQAYYLINQNLVKEAKDKVKLKNITKVRMIEGCLH
jgi:hypothetical protein